VVITLSRQAESGGDEVAEIVAREGGLRLADRIILEQMAQYSGIPVAHVRFFDESVHGTIESLLVEWQTSVSHATYLRRLAHTLLALEREGNVVLIGRGAAFVLTNPGTLHVRIIAPLPCRVARVMEQQGLSRVQAERVLHRSDEERARFVQQSFGAQIDNPAHYDLVLNTAEISQHGGGTDHRCTKSAQRRKSCSSPPRTSSPAETSSAAPNSAPVAPSAVLPALAAATDGVALQRCAVVPTLRLRLSLMQTYV
jgi:cytidylate kinase